MDIGLNVETIAIVITLVSIIITFIQVKKRKGWKAALLAVMRTIQGAKVDEETKEKVEAALKIAEEIKKQWDKNSKVKAIANIGSFIDTVYDAQVKDIEKWKNKIQ